VPPLIVFASAQALLPTKIVLHDPFWGFSDCTAQALFGCWAARATE